jgi:Protein of unknown function (DUF3047)
MVSVTACRALSVGWGLISLIVLQPSHAEPVWIGRFEASDAEIPPPWEVRSIARGVPQTQYRVRMWDDVPAVEALADRSMAMLARPVRINLAQTPVFCWRWRVDAPIAAADMLRKSGDDYAARMYVAFRLPANELSTLTRFKLGLARRMFDSQVPDAALNYVWDNRQPVGTERPSSFTDRVQMLVLRSGADESGVWRSERRDILEDFTRLFRPGAAQVAAATQAVPPEMDFVAFGSDGDNTGSTAHAGFADLHFVARDESCIQR